jgi:hypothetical protein
MLMFDPAGGTGLNRLETVAAAIPTQYSQHRTGRIDRLIRYGPPICWIREKHGVGCIRLA